MSDILKLLLEAEQQAEALVKAAEAEREAMISQARAEARAAEQTFKAHIRSLRDEFVRRAETRATEDLNALKRHYDQRKVELQSTVEQHQAEAVSAALALLLDPSKA
jgi:V/A-type H+/Na+-transporting ATPase subunit G/H